MKFRTPVLSTLASLAIPLLGILAYIPLVAKADPPPPPFSDSDLVTGRNFRTAFSGVIEHPAKSTVVILAGEKRIAFGTIVSSDGFILTKASQTTSADQVRLPDGAVLPIVRVGISQPVDLSLFKVEAAGLTSATWDASEPLLGEWFITVGDQSAAVAVGVMSTAKLRIPRSDVHGYLGVRLARESLPKIEQVFPNSGASNAGLQEGDVVLEIDQEAITSGGQLVKKLRDYRPGDTLTIRVKRAEEELPYSVTLMHPYGEFLSRMAFQNQMGGSLSFRRDDFESVYQHDSVLAPEECGGPVVNLEGRVVGINIARAGRTETYALPTATVLATLNELMSSPMNLNTLEASADSSEPMPSPPSNDADSFSQ
ncbi:S1C family serine protease [Planctomicrobium sp. SH668]|uniref:S1C family serine protease n=1 Tax=Planctomicrobium sp. SH668 TaxID=3448126 RepID=UPI003F5C8D8B